MHWEQQVRYAAMTDIGFRRQNNQDACAVALCSTEEEWQESGHLFVVADGMGGHAVGELASKIAVDTVPHTFAKTRDHHPVESLRIAIEAANDAINERGSKNLEFLRMGTTCSALVLCPQGAVVGHVGDSRVYRIRNRLIEQLTFDHSLVWEMIHTRQVSPQDAERLCPRNVITRSLGPEPQVDVDVEGPFSVEAGDIFLLCSDGLCGLLSDAEIGMIASSLSPDAACRLLVNMANLRGGPDNITVIVVHTGDLPEGVDEVYELPPSAPMIEGLSWVGFGVMCMFAALFMVGLYFFELDRERRLQGGIILSIATVSAIAFWTWHRSRTRHRSSDHDHNFNQREIKSPYQAASTVITDDFIEKITRLESDLHLAGLEDRWAVNWDAYEKIYESARQAVDKRVFGRALVEYGQLFDTLMTAIQQQRRAHQRELLKKKSSSLSIATVREFTAGGEQAKH